jgi:dTDP-4-amino-4,6-dideoxygalactose transaminase
MELVLKIPFNSPFVVGKELFYIAKAVLENRQISGAGPFTRKCQEWLESHLGSPRALLTHSCTAALEMAAILLDVGPGDEVIMPSFTFVSTANAFVLRRATPVFIDIERRTMNLDAALLEQALTPRTKAIVPVHYAGMPCEMDRIMDFAEKHGLFVVEDAAQALLSTHQGRHLGAIGHLGCISFHETKNIISGEGGALLVNDPRFDSRAEIIWEKGTNRRQHFRGEVDKYTWLDIGSSFLPSEIIAAFLFAQFENAQAIIAKRCATFHRYMEALTPLAEMGCLGLPPAELSNSCNAHIFYVTTTSLDERSRLIKHLASLGISSVFHYVPLHSSPAGQRFGRVATAMTVTEEMSDRILRLPLFYEMNHSEVDAVVDGVYSFFGLQSGMKGRL